MGHLTSSFLLFSLLLGIPAGSQTHQKFVFNFAHDLEGWESQRSSWRWADESSLQDHTIPSGGNGGFAVMDKKFTSDELFTPYFTAPKGGNFTMKFYLRSKYAGSNNLEVYTRNKMNIVKMFLNLKQYSQITTDSWITTQKELPPTAKDIRFQIFCYNGVQAPAGDPLLGCAIDQVTFEVYSDPATAEPTTVPQTTAYPTTVPQTTDYPTTVPQTTAYPTTVPQTTAYPTTVPQTTAYPTTVPQTTDYPTTVPQTTAYPTTAEPTTVPQTTAYPTTVPQTTAYPTTAYPTTDYPTTVPQTTAYPTTGYPTTVPQTTAYPTTDYPTTVPQTTDYPTTVPHTTAYPTTVPQTTDYPTTAASTTTVPNGPTIFSFESGMDGWSLVHMNNGAFRRVSFDTDAINMRPPPDGPMVLQVSADNVQSGTVVAKSPRLQATKDEMMLRVTFWMNGTEAFPAQLKLRRQFSYDTFEETPVMILDPFGDKANNIWITYTAFLSLKEGETFYLFMEASLGGDIKNQVAVSSVVVDGVRIIEDEDGTLFNFEGGLEGWTPGMMEGGVWELTKYDDLDSDLNIPKPKVGEKFLIASRSSIHSGVISLESPIFKVTKRQSHRLMFQFYTRGTLTYPVVLRIRKKTPDGTYDALPFIDLRKYGTVDYQQWLKLDTEIEIPVNPQDTQYQLVIEVDMGSWQGNVVALDDFEIKTL